MVVDVDPAEPTRKMYASHCDYTSTRNPTDLSRRERTVCIAFRVTTAVRGIPTTASRLPDENRQQVITTHKTPSMAHPSTTIGTPNWKTRLPCRGSGAEDITRMLVLDGMGSVSCFGKIRYIATHTFEVGDSGRSKWQSAGCSTTADDVKDQHASIEYPHCRSMRGVTDKEGDVLD